MEKQQLADMGNRLRQQRNALGLTREQFAELADIGTGYYGQIEVGTSQMSIDTLIKVAHTAKLPIEYILFGTPPEQGDPSDIFSLLSKCSERELKLAEQVLKLFLLKAD
ncbi:helix-turn-helix domain-containing protein [Oscillibacter ruminantium]|uniref:helix-turn-helix domain-containing protein n=1 Tax=Oscillibacter ruminantium TaxID=1263547 RepID=UPI00030AC4A0|nr:helix-turn-helix transcriptional regulator [Oscillibacter ruminantium]